MDGKDLAARFHALYEELASQHGYVTRTDTRVFDPQSPNGKLMIAVCAIIATDQTAAIAQAVAAEREACADIADAEADTAFEEATPSPSSGEPRIRCENIASDIRARKNP